eukprot:CAMPEP_0117030260 /NCGR_PEP_ID=MMETSP0472-20121206/21849_1 /TAXON_ID=693140 ORGANISM="Tiarina fusus, Strain LIS" /NCGR_SAMPLE_ID=MMETSP0472 /ASSEMBLY_ACC=CAM_ASM_000603 /LENGTH=322 /DNA_ID=CAMNT_0004738269 /DNA_START=27 /DNA_END=995 /DNA_ORIENTATION=+
MEKPLYDQSTMSGRAKQFYTITDPRSLFITADQLKQAEDLLTAYKERNIPPGVTDGDLWNARRIVESVIHPSTGKPITPFLRFSMYAPMNVFIVSAMVLPSTINSVPRTIAIHWYNQSYNAAVNYTNGSSASPVPTRRLVEGYIGAVGSSLGIALGATYITQKAANLGLAMRTLIRATLPFSAVVAAGCVNVALIRRNELTDGVEVYDKDDNMRGLSVKAGKQGILQCCAARFVWNVPAMIFPTVLMGYMATKPWWMKFSPRIRTGTEVVLISLALMIGVPPALGLFPQQASIPVSSLEERFQGIADKNGNPIETLYYNKGL